MLKRNINEGADACTISYYDGDKCIFSIQEQEKDGEMRIALQGELRSGFVEDFGDELAALVMVGTRMVVDFGELRYICTSAQNKLVGTQQKIEKLGRGELVLSNLPLAIRQEFEKIGLTEVLLFQD